MLKRLFGLLVLTWSILAPLSAQSSAELEPEWWRDSTWYLLFVRSFYDSDGDGIGDLRGVIEKLDYLNDGDPNTNDDLGVTGIWLLPIVSAASYHGYDAIDYFSVEPDYGTAEDFQALMEAAHARGIRIVVDLVLNHTSSKHPWFMASAAQDPEYADWYIWSDQDPAFAGPWGQDPWHPKAGRFYYGVFWSEMPDLNYENPDVTAQMYEAGRFWIEDMGADGFRLDAIKYVIEDEANGVRLLQNAPANRRWLADFRAYIKTVNPNAYLIGEVLDATIAAQKYIEDASVDEVFEFDLAQEYLNAANSGRVGNLPRMLRNVMRAFPDGNFAPLLTNHDFPRAFTQLNGDLGRARVAASLLLTSPGTPYMYYGEEIAMSGAKPDERIRTPMQWDATPVTAGFTSAARPWEALSDGFAPEFSVAQQSTDPASLLNHYRGLIHLRNGSEALRRGATLQTESNSRNVYSLIRQTENERLLVVINLGTEPANAVEISLDEGLNAPINSVELIWGEGTLNGAPVLTSEGGFDAYIPLTDLAPQSLYIIKLS